MVRCSKMYWKGGGKGVPKISNGRWWTVMDSTEACSGFKTENRASTTFPQDKPRAAARKKSRLLPSPNNSLMALSFSVARHRKSPGPGVSMIMYSLLFDFLMGFCLIIIAWLLRCAAEREPGSVKTKGGQILRCWHVACAALVSPLCLLLCDDRFSPWTWCQYVDVPFLY